MSMDETKRLIREVIKEIEEEKSKEPKKKFTITRFVAIDKDGEELITEDNVDYWMEDLLQSQYIIFAGDIEADTSLTFPATNLRSVVQNFGVKDDFKKFAELSEQMKKRKKLMEQQSNKCKNRDVDVA